MATTVFERCGGFASVRKVISAFYDKLLDSTALSGYFANVDMRRLIDHQTKFVSSIMGGPASFSDEALRRAHAKLGLSHEDLLEMGGLLRETLEDFDFEKVDIEHVCNEIMKRESLVVTRHA
ncbi:MAG: group 1 truncated hemoglobin [Kiloniellales bacterium]|jgi:hemoglobin